MAGARCASCGVWTLINNRLSPGRPPLRRQGSLVDLVDKSPSPAAAAEPAEDVAPEDTATPLAVTPPPASTPPASSPPPASSLPAEEEQEDAEDAAQEDAGLDVEEPSPEEE